jgi:HKD family nuclease
MDFPESSTTNFKLITTNLKTKIEEILENNRDLTSINLIVAFITYKGSRILLDWIKKYSLQNVRFKILTGTYADFTHPDALELLSDRENLSVKILDTIQDFKLHAKAYFIESPKKKLFILGSSNLTEGALTSNIEWNAIIDQFENQNYYEYCINQFSYLWNNAIDLTKDWIAEYRIRYKYSNAFDREREERDFDSSVPIPRFAQPEALESLERSRRQGFSSALVVLATGLGKTHLSAFDSIQYRKVLFIAHVKEILEQAEKIFKQVRKFGKIGNLEEGWHVLDTCDVIFATVQKISRDRNLTRFNQKQFDYIIVDEFHHAETSSYRKVLEYFSPIFLLGMTATPFRMDRQDITELCETNVPYICNMPDAIEKKWLIPFEYYGINDTTVDYEQIKWTSRGYDEKELTVNLNKEKRAEFILEEFKKYPVDPTVGFCATIEHADYMTEYFNTKGVPALAVHSGTNGKSPDVAKDKVKAKEIRVIFAVNVFNE